ncbi:rna ligase cyclic nucleotide phosphodiesterase [Trichoderma cornu-damae]|uniref:Rna ligase cyclic nucleotide phosphodiesterase n=1 Tax=Trichoderma cornu-damae TaxID=654480 RepID=A0A9P8QS80_9HYPO|nr:rna ligase cyclic nucleotide phosphodiesterase [Trichoderma cornu-damae]
MSATSTETQTAITPKRPRYPIGIPAKFSPDGVVQRFPGNTTLCHVPADSPLQAGLNAVHASLSSHAVLSGLIHLLPKDSWHMTVLDGVREAECEPGMWPPGLEKQPLDECTQHFSSRLRRLGLELADEGLAPPYRMRVRGFDGAVVGIGLEVEGATADEEKRMRRLRDRLADALGFRAPNHETEELGRVFARHLPALQGEFELGPVEFCTFENMHAFARLFCLGD